MRNTNVKVLLTLTVCLFFFTGIGAIAANIYVDLGQDGIGGGPAIWRYDAAGDPNPAQGKTGARFVEFTGEGLPAGGGTYPPPYDTGTMDNHCFAYGPDGYLYITTSNDPINKTKVRRANSAGQLDAAWSVSFGTSSTRGGKIRFAPDGRLYVCDSKGQVSKIWLIDIADQTSTNVLSIRLESIGDIEFDPEGRAYVSRYSAGVVNRYTISGTTWVQDPGFNATMPREISDPLVQTDKSGRAAGLAYNPSDGYLYVSDGGGSPTYRDIDAWVFRFDGSGERDPIWFARPDLRWESSPQIAGALDIGPDGQLYVATSHETPWEGYNEPTRVARCTTATPSVVTDFLVISGTQNHMSADNSWDGPIAGSISGHIDLQNFNLAKVSVAVKVDLILDGSTVRTETVVVDSASGSNYSIPLVAPGNYSVAFKAASWLGKTVNGKLVNSGVNTPGCDVTLLSGDVDCDDEVTTTDLSHVLRNVP